VSRWILVGRVPVDECFLRYATIKGTGLAFGLDRLLFSIIFDFWPLLAPYHLTFDAHRSLAVNQLPSLTPVLPHGGMLLEGGGTGVRFTSEGTSSVLSILAAISRWADLVRSVLSSRCTIECCGEPNSFGALSLRRPMIVSAVSFGSTASQLSIVATCGVSKRQFSGRSCRAPSTECVRRQPTSPRPNF
jgi:hypothetical protein